MCTCILQFGKRKEMEIIYVEFKPKQETEVLRISRKTDVCKFIRDELMGENLTMSTLRQILGYRRSKEET